MITKIFKFFSFVIISISLLSVMLFLASTSINAADLTKEDNGENPLKIVIKPSEDGVVTEPLKEEMSMEDIFGSEQVFPFEAGFGKNSGKS